MPPRLLLLVLLGLGSTAVAAAGQANRALENAQTLTDNYATRAAELRANHDRALARLYATYHTRMQTQAQAADAPKQSADILAIAQHHDPARAGDWTLARAWWGASYGVNQTGAGVGVDLPSSTTHFEAAPHHHTLGPTDHPGPHYLTLTLQHGNDEVVIRIPQSTGPQAKARVSVVRTDEHGDRQTLRLAPPAPVLSTAVATASPRPRREKSKAKAEPKKKEAYSFKYEYYLIDTHTNRRYDPDAPARRFQLAQRWHPDQLGITLYLRNNSILPRIFRGKLEAGDKTKLLSSTETTILGRGDFTTRRLEPSETGQVDVIIRCNKPHIVDFVRVADVR